MSINTSISPNIPGDLRQSKKTWENNQTTQHLKVNPPKEPQTPANCCNVVSWLIGYIKLHPTVFQKSTTTSGRKIPTTMPAKGQRCPEKFQEFSVSPWFFSEFPKLPQNQQILQTSLCLLITSWSYQALISCIVMSIYMHLHMAYRYSSMLIVNFWSFLISTSVGLIGFRGFPARGADPPVSMYLEFGNHNVHWWWQRMTKKIHPNLSNHRSNGWKIKNSQNFVFKHQKLFEPKSKLTSAAFFFLHFFATPFRSIILGCKGWAFRWLTTKLPHFEQRVLRSRLIFGLALRYTTPRIDFPQPTEETTPNWQQYKIKSQYSAKALGAGAASGGSVVHSVEYAGVGAAMLTAPGAGVVWKPLKGV